MKTAMCAFMIVKSAIDPTPAFQEYCNREPVACMQTGSNQRLTLDQQTWEKVNFINKYVNHSIVGKTDKQIYGVNDYWKLPATEGDCEDMVLLKQKFLKDNGIDVSNSLITVVTDENKEGHAVLTLRTDRGDFILDNKTDEIKLWSTVPYKFFARQSYRDYKLFLKIQECKD